MRFSVFSMPGKKPNANPNLHPNWGKLEELRIGLVPSQSKSGEQQYEPGY